MGQYRLNGLANLRIRREISVKDIDENQIKKKKNGLKKKHADRTFEYFNSVKK